MVKVEPLIYKLDTYSDDSMFTLYMCLTDVLGASAQAVKVAGSVAAEVLDDASKLAPGLVLLSNDKFRGERRCTVAILILKIFLIKKIREIGLRQRH